MTRNETIQLITDYVLKKTNNVNSVGLYNGKAGLSLALFVASKYLQDENIEDKAYQLLMEALIDLSNVFSFEDGWAGIGYALLYLIENKYLDADFDEIFYTRYKQITNHYRDISDEPVKLLSTSRVIYFLTNVKKHTNEEDGMIQSIIQKYFEGIELFLSIQFHDFSDIHYINRKVNVLDLFYTYLKLACYANYSFVSRLLLDDYAKLYRKGKVVSSFEVGFYFNQIAGLFDIKGYDDITFMNIHDGDKNICLEALSLKDKIDAIRCLHTTDKE